MEYVCFSISKVGPNSDYQISFLILVQNVLFNSQVILSLILFPLSLKSFNLLNSHSSLKYFIVMDICASYFYYNQFHI
ncbi:hypothetical protein VNO77_32347 [Canavalia gladiata]|uniref:Uncharacterized protein n=1 Tax=Canavalia gladiata TaxID=3824 RepID=A0AAN9KRS4_CANGL